jgi:hypothetical protein
MVALLAAFEWELSDLNMAASGLLAPDRPREAADREM